MERIALLLPYPSNQAAYYRPREAGPVHPRASLSVRPGGPGRFVGSRCKLQETRQ